MITEEELETMANEMIEEQTKLKKGEELKNE